MEAQETYRVVEAAQYLNVKTKDIYHAMELGRLQKVDATKGNYRIAHIDLMKYKETYLDKGNGTKTIPSEKTLTVISPHVEPVKQIEPPKEVKKQDDGPLLQRVLSSVFSFLSQHSFSIGLRSLEEVDASLRLWVVKTPETNLSIVASGDQVTVLSQEYQKRLEAHVETLSQELKSKEKTLAILRGKPREVILHEYAQPLIVLIEPRTEGFVARCELFPFAGSGSTEEEALAAYKRVLWGYTKWLSLHLEKLSSELKAQFELLNELLLEDKYV